MDSGGVEPRKSSPAEDRPLRCSKCGHRNAAGATLCASCGAHLYVACQSCGHRNERSRFRCSECRHKLHRSWFAHFHSRGTDKIPVLQIVLLVLGILLGLAVIVYFSQVHVPEPEGSFRPSRAEGVAARLESKPPLSGTMGLSFRRVSAKLPKSGLGLIQLGRYTCMNRSRNCVEVDMDIILSLHEAKTLADSVGHSGLSEKLSVVEQQVLLLSKEREEALARCAQLETEFTDRLRSIRHDAAQPLTTVQFFLDLLPSVLQQERLVPSQLVNQNYWTHTYDRAQAAVKSIPKILQT